MARISIAASALSAAGSSRSARDGYGEMRASSCSGRFCSARSANSSRSPRSAAAALACCAKRNRRGSQRRSHEHDRHCSERHRQPQRDRADDVLCGLTRLGDLVGCGCGSLEGRCKRIADQRHVADSVTGAGEILREPAAGFLEALTWPGQQHDHVVQPHSEPDPQCDPEDHERSDVSCRVRAAGVSAYHFTRASCWIQTCSAHQARCMLLLQRMQCACIVRHSPASSRPSSSP